MAQLGRILLWLVLIYLLLCLAMTLSQRHLLYLPTPKAPASVPALRLAGPEGDLVVHPVQPGRANAVFYFGGNAEAVYRSADSLARALPGCTLYLVNYPGYGGSAGQPSEATLTAAALSAYDQLSSGHQQLAAIGRSLGSAVALSLAARRPLQRQALLTPFASLEALAYEHYPWLPASLLLWDRYDLLALAPAVTSPSLVLLAQQDRVVPLAASSPLLSALKAPTIVEVAGTHNRFDATASLAAFFHPICGAL
ncbi:conserved hypothetical protein [Ferrimonas balearica DSM 9799]|uniref:AB hydrolase-1 domain-containing protein n=1 Tax=Ferrimonas balearica (strain DSM 9799 / CCM 4581 / KCTC 23876 / PAT) TaxID=550540 RepID=E1SNY7_FERBD|nr:alpha/beta fold hydrolase [Ferrimonas balearica]ADN74636.1 conserved hypothetical protein [Ferrimonas balearica DSM 9799]